MARPSLIRTADGRDVASQGTVWVVPQDGTVVRTRLAVSGFAGVGSTATVDVAFARDERLGLWLPAQMTERHGWIAPAPRGGVMPTQSVVTATATYGDFKRSETSTSISIKR
jgi:hypothetical protein